MSGCFCHGLKYRGGNKPHIHVSDNRLMDANVCWAFPTPPTWLLRLSKIRKCLHICKCMLYLYWICSNRPSGLHVCNLTFIPWHFILTRAKEKYLIAVNRNFSKLGIFFLSSFTVNLLGCILHLLSRFISSSDRQVFFYSTRTPSAHLWIWIGEKC